MTQEEIKQIADAIAAQLRKEFALPNGGTYHPPQGSFAARKQDALLKLKHSKEKQV